MHEFWTIPTTDMTYIRLQNYTNMMVGKNGTQTFEVVVVVVLLSFDAIVPTSAHPLLFLDKWFVQIYFNVRYSRQPRFGVISLFFYSFNKLSLRSFLFWHEVNFWLCSISNIAKVRPLRLRHL